MATNAGSKAGSTNFEDAGKDADSDVEKRIFKRFHDKGYPKPIRCFANGVAEIDDRKWFSKRLNEIKAKQPMGYGVSSVQPEDLKKSKTPRILLYVNLTQQRKPQQRKHSKKIDLLAEPMLKFKKRRDMQPISDNGQSMYSDGKTYTSKEITLRKVTFDMLSANIEEKYHDNLMFCNLSSENITKMFYDKDGWVYFPIDSNNDEERFCRFYLRIEEWKFKVGMTEKLSRSDEQQMAEKDAVKKVGEWLNLGDKLEKNKKITISDGIYIEPDFYLEEPPTVGEFYAHIGKLKPGQQKKISQDILKMLLLEKSLNKTFRKIIAVIDDQVVEYLKGHSFIAETIRQFNIEVKKIEITESILKSVKEAQERQIMKNG